MNRDKLKKCLEQEIKFFLKMHPKSKEYFQRSKKCYLDGVPMYWMLKWPGGYPVVVKEAYGSHFTDIDDNEYIDLCMGYSGALFGHTPPQVIDAVHNQMKKGMTYTLPTETDVWVGEELQQRFELPYWQLALSATDANRFAIRLARFITKRKYILVFNWCYHGTVDEAFITMNEIGVSDVRIGNLGYAINPKETTKVIEFNDIEALKKALDTRDVACVLAEPALTNIGIVYPQQGYVEALKKITEETGTLLIIDETHTITGGPGGYAKEIGLKPDILTIGKPIGGGIPVGAYGVSEKVATMISSTIDRSTIDVAGIGGTLTANAVSVAAMKASFEHLFTDSNYSKMVSLMGQWIKGVEDVIQEFDLPWGTAQIGCRGEYRFMKKAPRNGTEALGAEDLEMYEYLFLYALNRGILLSPYFNIMAVTSPELSEKDINHHTHIFREGIENLMK